MLHAAHAVAHDFDTELGCIHCREPYALGRAAASDDKKSI